MSISLSQLSQLQQVSNLPTLSTMNYVRPDGGTYQDSLQNKKDMLEKLVDYERVDSVDDIPLKTHVRYVTLNKDSVRKQVFRLGGILEAIHPKYVKLSNGQMQWSVQRYHYNDGDVTENSTASDEPIFETVFWKYLSKEDNLASQVDELHDIIKNLELKNAELLEENSTLRKYIENINT